MPETVQVVFIRRVGNTLAGAERELTLPRARRLIQAGKAVATGNQPDKEEVQKPAAKRGRAKAESTQSEKRDEGPSTTPGADDDGKRTPGRRRKPRAATSKPAVVEPGGFDKDDDVDANQVDDSDETDDDSDDGDDDEF